jgi:glycosyltransferase involved in cell wall biosynthesis
MKLKYDISIVIPFLNEEENLPLLIGKLENSFKKKKQKIQVIFVDDGSTDNSCEILLSSKTCHFSKKLIKLSKNFGSHAAIRSGVLHSEGKYTTFLAADLQEDPEQVFDFYHNCLNNNYDVLILYRESYSNSFLEKLFSIVYSALIKILVSKDIPNKNMSNFFINNKAKEVLNKNIVSNSSILLQIYFMGFKKGFAPYKQSERKSGKSKWTLSKKIKAFIDSLVSFSYVPLRLITISGFTFFLVGSGYIVFVLVNHFLYHNIQIGWPTLISILLMGFGITNISLGIISEYLWRIYDNSKNNPVFIIDEIYEIK